MKVGRRGKIAYKAQCLNANIDNESIKESGFELVSKLTTCAVALVCS